jgi:hypothetical protein
MRSTIIGLLITAVVILLLCGIVYLEVELWNECRQEHSWLYCMRVLGK